MNSPLSRPAQRPRALRVAAAAAALALGLAMAACQGGESSSGNGGSTGGSTDDGTTLTMWTRSSTSDFTTKLVNAYNAGHRNKVQLTVIPFDAYQQKVGSAAGARQLPDVLASDVVYTPNYTSKNLYLDITDRINALPFKDKLAPGHIKAGTFNDRLYAVPHDIDLSAVFYNKVLFRKAGLDPDKPPTTVKEMAEDAKKINALGGGVHGFYFGGNCGGCQLFTTWPMIWASGGEVLNADGTESTLDTPQAASVYTAYKDLFDSGVAPADAKNENGSTWVSVFQAGKIGIQPLGATVLGTLKEGPDLEVGVGPIPGVDGGESSFVGGDVLGITATSKKADAAWNFISWTLSDEAQIETIAKGSNIPARSDLASNKYSQQDPRLVTLNELAGKGKTPYSVNFGQTYNDANGPWLQLFRAAVFGSDVPGALRSKNQAITDALKSGS